MTTRAERTPKITKIFKKLEKNKLKISIKLCVFSDRLFERSHRGGGCTKGLRGREDEGGNSGVGATARWGVGAIGGVTTPPFTT